MSTTKKKPKSKPIHQWCTTETYVNELLGIHKDITIDQITFEIGFSLKRVIATISDALRECGVTYLREPSYGMEAQGTLSGARAKIKRNAQQICTTLSLDYRHMRIRRAILSYNGTRAFFTRMTKQMDIGEDNKSLRVKVLGLVRYTGEEKDLNKIIKLLTARKVTCTYTPRTIMEVICTE